MAVASLGPYGVHNMMLMRNDNNADTLVAMLGSCSPHLSLQQVSRSMGGMEEVTCGGRLGGQLKRPYYAPSYGEEPGSEDGDDGGDEFSQQVEKKRRLSFDQVRSLERNFEVENKLEPERKMQLAKELGLQPRQVAVWFQNRRARWKIKQLERDFEALTQDYHRLQADLDAVTRDKNSLKAEMNRLMGVTPTDDTAKAVESEQCRSDHPDSPVPSEQSDIDHPSPRPSPAVDDVNPAKDAVVKRTSSSTSINSSHVVDVDSPCTSDSSRSSAPSNNRTSPPPHSEAQHQSVPGDAVAWTQYAQFPPESFVGPHLVPDLCCADDHVVFQAHRGAGVKIEDMDPSFLLSRLEEQPVLPNWWDWA